MKRLPYFAILAFACGFPALAQDASGNVIPLSLKDTPVISRDIHRNDPATARTRYICYGDGLWPLICDVASNKQGAPEKRKASGAR